MGHSASRLADIKTRIAWPHGLLAPLSGLLLCSIAMAESPPGSSDLSNKPLLSAADSDDVHCVDLRVSQRPGRISAQWREKPLQVVLDCLSERIGFDYQINAALSHMPITASVQNHPLPDVLDKLLRGLNTVVLYTNDEQGARVVRRIIVLGTGAVSSEKAIEVEAGSPRWVHSDSPIGRKSVDAERFPPGMLDALQAQASSHEKLRDQDLVALRTRALNQLLQRLESSLGPDSTTVQQLKNKLGD